MYVVFAMLVCYFGLNGGLAVPWWISDSLTKGNQHFAFDDIQYFVYSSEGVAIS